MINAQSPDVVLIGGDLIDSSVQPLHSERMDEELSALNAPLGVYMVPGNHEYISGIDDCIGFLAKTPIVLLRDSVVTLECGLQIAGRDDRANLLRKGAGELLVSTDKSMPVFLLDHQPYGLAENDALGIDVQFSGHTHGGQLWPGNLLVRRMYEQATGCLRLCFLGSFFVGSSFPYRHFIGHGCACLAWEMRIRPACYCKWAAF